MYSKFAEALIGDQLEDGWEWFEEYY